MRFLVPPNSTSELTGVTRQQSGPWSFDGEPPAHSERLTIAWLDWSIDTLTKLGCAPDRLSRFPESLRYIGNVRANPNQLERPEAREQLAEIQRSAWELLLIVLGAVQVDRAISPFTREKLDELLGGGFAADDSHARNIQFELYVAALFIAGQFTVRRGRPDAQVLLFGEYLGIEAKRFGSTNPDTIRRTLSRAAGQVTGKSDSRIIEVVRSRGLLAVNLDGLFESVETDVGQELLIKEFERQLLVLDRETRVLRDKPGIVGILATGHVARWRLTSEPRHWRIDTLYALRWLGVHGDDHADEVVTKQVMPHMDRLRRNVLALRTKVPKKLSGPIPPAA